MVESTGTMGTTGRVAVVTGAASGMGLAIARHLAAGGHRVGVLDLQGDAARQAAADLRDAGATAIGVESDVIDRRSVDAALDKVRAELGPIAIMITSAGIEAFEPFAEITTATWERILAINLTGTFHCLQAAVPDMLGARWGRMVTISSSSAQSGAPRMAHYVASKGGVIGLTRALALELAPQGITVNTITPGMIDTPMLRRAAAGGDIGQLAKVAARMVPVGRPGTPEEIAATCGFLCSDEAGFITGQVVGVNGGMVL
jgi:NAD(P)-dependent dehydrogenase (short-subunit alcohol dehydrogenase family)